MGQTIDLGILTHEGFLNLGKAPGYKLQRTPLITIKKADGKTEAVDRLSLFNELSDLSGEEKFPSRGDLLRIPHGGWCLLEDGYVAALLEFKDDENKMLFENGQEAFCRDIPWEVIVLHEKTDFIARSGKVVQYSCGDYIAESNPKPFFTVIPYQSLEMGGYNMVHKNRVRQ